MRKLVRHITLFFCILLTLTSCDWGCRRPDEPTTPQTLIVYLVGTNLNWAFNKNVQDIESALQKNIKGDSRVIVVWQNTSADAAEAIELVYNDGIIERQLLTEYPLSNIMTGDDLGYILSDVMRQAPAKSYGMIVGAHSWAWVPINDLDEVKNNGMSRAELRMIPQIELPRHLQTRFIGDPSGKYNRFEISTIAEAIAYTEETFEYILFDACFMANVEAVFELRNSAKYIIGSACEIMGNGFPYTQTIPYLLLNGGRSYDLEHAAESYHTHYKNTLGYSGTVSLINCSQLDALASAMKEVNKSLRADFDRNAIQTYEGGTNHIFFDLGDYVSKVCTNPKATSALLTQLQKSVPTKYTLDTFWSTYIHADHYPVTSFSGLSTSAPSVLLRSSYPQTAWYKATH